MIIPIGYATAGLIIDPTTAGEAFDERQGNPNNSFTGLHMPTDVKVIYNGTNPYAVVTAMDDDKVSIIDLSDPNNPVELSTVADQQTTALAVGFMAMDAPKALQVWENVTSPSSGYYAAVASNQNDGVQILDLGNPTDISTDSRSIYNATDSSPAGSTGGGSFESHAARATSGHFNSATPMDGASDIALLNNGSDASPAYFVIVSGYLGDGIQLYNARDVGDEGGHFEIAGNISNAGQPTCLTGQTSCGRHVLDGVTAVDTFSMTNTTVSRTQSYGIAVAQAEDGIQVFSLTNPYIINGGTNATSTTFPLLDGANDVATWDHYGTPHAIITSNVTDSVQVFDLSGGAVVEEAASQGGCTPDRNQQQGATCLKLTDSLTNSEGSDLALDGANRVEIVTVAERTYAIITANGTAGSLSSWGGGGDPTAGGVQIIDVSDPKNIDPVASIFGNSTSPNSRGGFGLDTFVLGDHTYVVVANAFDDAIQVIQLTGIEQGKGNNAVCGTNRDCSAPSINSESDGFSINNANLPNNDRFNNVDETESTVGKLVTIKARIYDSFGTNAIEKANLYFDMPNVPAWDTASAAIEYDVTRDSLTIKDVNDIFDADVTTKVVGDRLEVTYKIMFTDEMSTSHVAMQTVDVAKNYQLLYFKDALTVVGQSTGPTQTSADETIGDEVTQTTASVPAWVKNTAGWWAEGKISEVEFVKGVEFLIKQQIIDTSVQTTSSTGTGSSVPDWVKNTAGWWAEGEISEGEFVNAIEHLVKTGTIIVI